MNTEPFEISASVLPSAHDCMRRCASKAFGARKPKESKFGKLLIEAGFEFPPAKTNYGQVVGSSIHNIVDHFIKGYGEEESIEAGVSYLYENGAQAEGDSTTPTMKMAEHQTVLIGKYVIQNILPTLDIAFNELELKAQLNENFVIVGHIDIGSFNELDQINIRDWKFGKNAKGYMAQIGTYDFLLDFNDWNTAKEHYIDHIPRTKGSVKHEEIKIDAKKANLLARATVRNITNAIKLFEKTGNPEVFIANPSSSLCSAKFCPAFGTKFCPYTGEQ